jgi:hypothetical protein
MAAPDFAIGGAAAPTEAVLQRTQRRSTDSMYLTQNLDRAMQCHLYKIALRHPRGGNDRPVRSAP